MKRLLKQTTKQAFTLVELTLYLALFGIIFTAVIEFTLGMVQNYQAAEQRINLSKNVILINQELNLDFRATSTIDTDNSIFNSDQGKLTLNTDSGVVSYILNSGDLTYTSGGQSNTDLWPDVTCSQFYLDKILDAQNNLLGVRLTLTLKSIKSNRIQKTTTTSYLIRSN